MMICASDVYLNIYFVLGMNACVSSIEGIIIIIIIITIIIIIIIIIIMVTTI